MRNLAKFLFVRIALLSSICFPMFLVGAPSPAPQAAATTGGSASAPAQAASVGAKQAGDFTLRFGEAGEVISMKNGHLTLKIMNRAISTVLGLITQETHIPIVDTEGALKDKAISLDFQNQSFGGALKLLLRDYDVFYLYSSDGDAPATLQHVWVYAKGQGQNIDPVPFEACASSKELRAMAGSSDPDQRGRALETLLAREGNKAQDLVMQGLNSSNSQDRNLALYYAMENGVEIPTTTLTSLAVGDNSPAIRAMALEALAGRNPQQTEWVLVQALSDPDTTVRARAKEMMQQLHAHAGP